MSRLLVTCVTLGLLLPSLTACGDDADNGLQAVASASATSFFPQGTFGTPTATAPAFGGMGGMGGNTAPDSTVTGTIDANSECPASTPENESTCTLGFLTMCNYDGATLCQCFESGEGGGREWLCSAAVGSECPESTPQEGSSCVGDSFTVCTYTRNSTQCSCSANVNGESVWDCGSGQAPPEGDGGTVTRPDGGVESDGGVKSDGGAELPDAHEPTSDVDAADVSAPPPDAATGHESDTSVEPAPPDASENEPDATTPVDPSDASSNNEVDGSAGSH